MKWTVRPAAIAVLLAALLSAAAYAGDSLTEFSLTTVDGSKFEYRAGSSPLVMNIGSHWCQPCKSEAPELQKAYQANRDKGVRFVGMFVSSSDDDIRKFAETYGITFPVGKENGLAKKLGIRGIPATIFVGKDGGIIKKYLGEITPADLEQNIRAILK